MVTTRRRTVRGLAATHQQQRTSSPPQQHRNLREDITSNAVSQRLEEQRSLRSRGANDALGNASDERHAGVPATRIAEENTRCKSGDSRVVTRRSLRRRAGVTERSVATRHTTEPPVSHVDPVSGQTLRSSLRSKRRRPSATDEYVTHAAESQQPKRRRAISSKGEKDRQQNESESEPESDDSELGRSDLGSNGDVYSRAGSNSEKSDEPCGGGAEEENRGRRK